MSPVDRLVLAGDAAAILDRLGVSAYGKRADGRVTIDGWATQNGKRIAFSYEVDPKGRHAGRARVAVHHADPRRPPASHASGHLRRGASSSRMGAARGAPPDDRRARVLALRLARDRAASGPRPGPRRAKAREYEGLRLESLADSPLAEGPLAGLLALLEAGRGESVVALACDLPTLAAALVQRLAQHPRQDPWPRVATDAGSRSSPATTRRRSNAPASRARAKLSLQLLLEGAAELPLTGAEAAQLDDWDAPDDVARDPSLASMTSRREVTVFDGEGEKTRPDRVAVEEALEIRAAGETVSVTMRTPGADVDLAVGFLLGEGVIRSRDDVASVAPLGPNVVSLDLRGEARERLARTGRRFWATSSCGICGIDSIARVEKDVAPVHDDMSVPAAMVMALPASLRAAQMAFDRTGGLHAAGLFRRDGDALVPVRVAEDVGRHTALDKVLGAELLAGHVPLRPSRRCALRAHRVRARPEGRPRRGSHRRGHRRPHEPRGRARGPRGGDARRFRARRPLQRLHAPSADRLG